MLSRGFIDDIDRILDHTPESADGPFFGHHAQAHPQLAEKHMRSGEITIKVKADNSPNIRQRFIKVGTRRNMLTGSSKSSGSTPCSSSPGSRTPLRNGRGPAGGGYARASQRG